MKIILREGDKTFALRGVMMLRQTEEADADTTSTSEMSENEDQSNLTTYETAADFDNAPDEFFVFAERLWKDYVVEEL